MRSSETQNLNDILRIYNNLPAQIVFPTDRINMVFKRHYSDLRNNDGMFRSFFCSILNLMHLRHTVEESLCEFIESAQDFQIEILDELKLHTKKSNDSCDFDMFMAAISDASICMMEWIMDSNLYVGHKFFPYDYPPETSNLFVLNGVILSKVPYVIFERAMLGDESVVSSLEIKDIDYNFTL